MEFGSSVTGCDNQKKKPHKKQKANECEDIISNLPESLISRILSFLPTEDAVCTSVLSKRWINRWTTINKLVLDEYLFYSHKRRRGTGRNQHFVNFVNRALLLTKGSTMESIHLDINDSEFDESLLNTWLSSIFNGSVKHLNICLNVKISFSPLTLHSLFNSMSLEELVLEMSWCNIKVPTTNVYFRYLKSLVFTGIDFTVDSSGDHLSLSLPVLKKFKTGDCAWINAKNIVVEAPLLEIIYIDQDLLWPSEPRGSAITFSTLHLKELTYLGNDTSRTVILSDPSSAYNASAHISLYQSGDVFPELVSNAFLLLKQFSHMKCIEFDGAEVLTQPELAILPVFAMLRHLVLGSITGEVLLGLLQRSPVLKTLVLNKGISKVDQDLFNSAVVPHCLASTLRVVKFGSFNRDEHELCLAKYFMENCVVLEKMSFSRFRP